MECGFATSGQGADGYVEDRRHSVKKAFENAGYKVEEFR